MASSKRELAMATAASSQWKLATSFSHSTPSWCGRTSAISMAFFQSFSCW